MTGKFHPDDLRNPVYEHSQVVTIFELKAMYNGLAVQYKDTKWWQFKHRHDIKVAALSLYEIIRWLQEGKPTIRGTGENK